ncbi:oxidoreductase FAD-binding domain-containing protein [Halogeometricum pallidum JCM 14848]|uniref:Oxidoreductase FAD-binding domain-containing protein n=1 Tax=Halogeometricum pallidum JCM 14848 TaxID=1227487 RepID=M0D870_HALPD|nr:FAD-binding oxidoreductase [Halogeometricum pallidum]ELZ31008.1 oxidoreductase FAD-binding domain-containing protein [Halogeometricum pallidum JCM 14848]
MPVDPAIESRAAEAEIEDHDATVTDVTAMDRDREAEIDAAVDTSREAIRRRLDIQEALGPLGESGDAWDRVTAELSAQGEEELNGKIEALKKRLERPYPSLVRIRFEVGGAADDPDDTSFDYVPGQYARISYDDEEPRVYSIASSPNRDYVELCIRRVPGGELTPHLCTETKVGDSLFVRGPYGDELMLQEPSERDLVFIATGTGVAPFKSMINYVFEEGMDQYDGEDRDVWLFLGSSWEDHLPYHEEFRQLDEERGNFHYVPTLSRENYLTDWAGETDYVQYCLLRYLDREATDLDALPEEFADYADKEPTVDVDGDARVDPSKMEVYVCGIGAMCDPIEDVVASLGVGEEFLDVESYG